MARWRINQVHPLVQTCFDKRGYKTITEAAAYAKTSAQNMGRLADTDRAEGFVQKVLLWAKYMGLKPSTFLELLSKHIEDRGLNEQDVEEQAKAS